MSSTSLLSPIACKRNYICRDKTKLRDVENYFTRAILLGVNPSFHEQFHWGYVSTPTLQLHFFSSDKKRVFRLRASDQVGKPGFPRIGQQWRLHYYCWWCPAILLDVLLDVLDSLGLTCTSKNDPGGLVAQAPPLIQSLQDPQREA